MRQGESRHSILGADWIWAVRPHIVYSKSAYIADAGKRRLAPSSSGPMPGAGTVLTAPRKRGGRVGRGSVSSASAGAIPRPVSTSMLSAALAVPGAHGGGAVAEKSKKLKQ